jgi:hypothetical protein
MMVIFADGIIDCLGPFIGVIFFLLISVGSWIMQQIAAAKRQQRPPHASMPDAAGPVRDLAHRQVSPHASDYPASDEVYTAEVIAPRQLQPRVRTQVSTEDLSRHAAQLGEVLDQADERLEQRLHQQFDHNVGALGDSSDAIHEDPTKRETPKEAVTTREIVDVFRHPERVREAIIMAEILKRPV